MLALALIALIASATAFDPCTTCPASSTIKGDGSISCSCSFNSTQNVSLTRSYVIEDLMGAASFVWSTFTFPLANSSNVSTSFVNATNASVVLYGGSPSDSSAVNSSSDYVNAVHGNFFYNSSSSQTGQLLNISFSIVAKACSLTLTKNGQNFSWIADPAFSYNVYFQSNRSKAVGEIVGNTFVPPPMCTFGSYSAFSVLTATNIECKAGPSITLALTPVPSFTGLQPEVNYTLDGNNTELTLTLQTLWGPANGFACDSITYYAMLSSSNAVIEERMYAPGSYTNNGTAVYPNTLFNVTRSDWNFNDVYTFTVLASTAVGNSTQVKNLQDEWEQQFEIFMHTCVCMCVCWCGGRGF